MTHLSLMWTGLKLGAARALSASWKWMVAAALGAALMFAVRAAKHVAKGDQARPGGVASAGKVKAEIASALRPGVQRMAERERMEAAAALARADAAHAAATQRRYELARASDDDVIRAWQAYDRARRARHAQVKRRALPALVLAWSMAVSHASADGVDCASSAGQEPCRAAHVVTGAPGLWLPVGLYREAISDLEELPICHAQVAELEASSAAHARRADTLEHEAVITSDTISAIAKAASRQRARAERAESRLRSWLRKPWVWLSAGVVVGGFGGWRLAR